MIPHLAGSKYVGEGSGGGGEKIIDVYSFLVPSNTSACEDYHARGGYVVPVMPVATFILLMIGVVIEVGVCRNQYITQQTH